MGTNDRSDTRQCVSTSRPWTGIGSGRRAVFSRSFLVALLLLALSPARAQLDDSIAEDQQLLAKVDEKLEEVLPMKNVLFFAGNFDEAVYINEIAQKREEATLTREEAEEFLEVKFVEIVKEGWKFLLEKTGYYRKSMMMIARMNTPR